MSDLILLRKSASALQKSINIPIQTRIPAMSNLSIILPVLKSLILTMHKKNKNHKEVYDFLIDTLLENTIHHMPLYIDFFKNFNRMTKVDSQLWLLNYIFR